MDVVTAPAKLTVSLRVTGVRDDGFHLIDAEMVTLDLADELTFSAGSGLELTGPAASTGDGPDDENLVVRALALVGRTAHVRVDKIIPAGAGLGGGSADAAAVLRWAGYRDLNAPGRRATDGPGPLGRGAESERIRGRGTSAPATGCCSEPLR
jgi:4-diphosphocytidyl-2-C-methyl-D-erythritol kinase